MAAVLGKRQRGALAAEGLPLRTPSKRRARAPQIHEEEEDNATRRLRSRTTGGGPQQENDVGVKSVKVRSTRAVRDGQARPDPDENASPAEFKTPRTSRYRDALVDSSPVTPKHRVQIGGKPLTPRTPRQGATPTAPQTVYARARQLFARSATSGRLVGRENEREQLTAFIQDGVRSRQGGCLYVSGPPGTGKSAMVEEVCRELDLQTVTVTHVNCVSMRSARDIYSKLVDDLCRDAQVFQKSEADRLQAMFVPTKPSADLYLVTLDEIDHLLTADAEVLYSLFGWSLHSKSRLLLIGIANALDLTERFLPRLKAQNLKPGHLPFLPYTAPQIANVITSRLRSLLPDDDDHSASADFVPCLHPAAIQLCAKKVASQTGDLRKAFDLVRRAIDLIELETQQKLDKERADPDDASSKSVLIENVNLSSPPRTPSLSRRSLATSYTAVTAPRATIAHIARITSAAFGQGTTQRLQGLNLQQKAALCALIALDRKRRDGDIFSTPSKSSSSRVSSSAPPTIKQLFDTYCALCRHDNILHPLTASEFRDVLGSLETMGLVGEVQGRGRGGTVAAAAAGGGGSGLLLMRSPSKSGSGPSTPSKGLDERALACFVTHREVESQISGPGEGILRRLLSGEGL
ncbi:hypothetical protein VTN02DRAFT_491 [Thermoascus thermophilus]